MSATKNAPIRIVKEALFPTKAKQGKVYKDIAIFRNIGIHPIKIIEPRTSKPSELFITKTPVGLVKPGANFEVEVTYRVREDSNEAIDRASIILDYETHQEV